jgi:hypothetical protein
MPRTTVWPDAFVRYLRCGGRDAGDGMGKFPTADAGVGRSVGMRVLPADMVRVRLLELWSERPR